MSRLVDQRKEDIGLSPDALVFRGERKEKEVLLDVIDFDAETLNVYSPKSISELNQLDETPTTSWLNVIGVHDAQLMLEISEKFSIDKIVLSQVMEPHKRPKAQEYENCFFITLKMLKYDEKNNEMSSENLSLIIKDNMLISFQEVVGDVFDPIRERITRNKKRIRTLGVAYLALALIDVVVDNYAYIIGSLGDRIEALEDELLDEPQSKTLELLNLYRKEMSFIRRAVHPCRELINVLVKTDSELLDDLDIYVKELQHNINFANEASENYWLMLSDYLNLYHTVISSRLNDIMKFLTMFSVIFIPATFIVGVYGTNFEILPEIHWHYGYFMMWGVILAISVSLITYFKYKKWF